MSTKKQPAPADPLAPLERDLLEALRAICFALAENTAGKPKHMRMQREDRIQRAWGRGLSAIAAAEALEGR